eukprot:CAMPEP_0115544796 /NCGR_PEP_ID=MMETSP0271-20121206/92272_1 /TAXON_ID=71861 /ORGANISM="Scrippsiella trochoidea, Strain CCMP3099" /LENGTH=68 /DNA_ID=CAMNT_0002978121 /DNA_START=1534 /DNA_END=1740 /DNA_ORIENTATION=-
MPWSGGVLGGAMRPGRGLQVALQRRQLRLQLPDHLVSLELLRAPLELFVSVVLCRCRELLASSSNGSS